jgi:predicted Zn finger-like uncharacterized protein
MAPLIGNISNAWFLNVAVADNTLSGNEPFRMANMIVKCPKCKSGYQIDETKIPAKGAHTRCKQCQTRFLVQKKLSAETAQNPPSPKNPQAVEKTPATRAAAAPADPADRQPAGPVSDEDRRVEQLLAAGDQEGASKLLLELITQAAGQSDFAKAEVLRDKLYEEAPLALGEIIKANEIIDEQKSKSIDRTHLNTWRKLYEVLESDEASEIYYAMKTSNPKAGEPVFEKGQYNSNLYFVQEGRLKLSHYDQAGKKEVTLKVLVPGDIANPDAFFSFTVTTYALVAAEDSRLTYLEQRILDHWHEKFAGIEPKLSSFCRSKEDLKAMRNRAGIEVRSSPRHIVSLKAGIQFLDHNGYPVKKPFKVNLFDISAGGLSFGLGLNKRPEAAQLLGQRIHMQTTFAVAGRKQKIVKKGRVIATHLQPFGESSVHVKFDKILADEIMADIEKLTEQPDDGV